MADVKQETTDPPVVQGVSVVQGKSVSTSSATELCGDVMSNDAENEVKGSNSTKNGGKIRVVPGEDWIGRQTTQEIMSLSWEEDEAPEVLSLLRLRHFLGCAHVMMIILFCFLFLFFYVDYGDKLWFQASLAIIFALQFFSLVKMILLENRLKDKFLCFQQHAAAAASSYGNSTSDRRLVRVIPDEHWISRHTRQEILSLSWDEDDLPEVFTLLHKRQRLAQVHGIVSAFLFTAFFVFLFGSPAMGETAMYILLGLIIGIFMISIFASTLNARLINTFQNKFDQRFCPSHGSDYEGQMMRTV